MSASITIRPLADNVSDFQKYINLLSQLSSQYQPITYEEYQKIYKATSSSTNTIYVGVMPNNDFFGTIKIIFEQKFYRPNCWVGHIEDVVVDKTYEGKGYGKLLVKYAIYLCKTHGCYKIRLSCSDHNIEFYKKSQFQVDGANLTIRLEHTSDAKEL